VNPSCEAQIPATAAQQNENSLTMQTLQAFCHFNARDNSFGRPFLKRGKIMATDGRILVAVDPDCVDAVPPDLAEGLLSIAPKTFPFDHSSIPAEAWTPVVAEPRRSIPCHRCKATGKVRICPHCEGQRFIYKACPTCGHERQARCLHCLDGNEKFPETDCDQCGGSGTVADENDLRQYVGAACVNNAGAVPRRGSDVGTSPLLAVSGSGEK
jgi:hypothetical protein